jgi:hypothetical protein
MSCESHRKQICLMTNFVDKVILRELIFFDLLGSSLPLHIIDVDLIKKEDTILECRIRVQANSQIYQRINTESLFNLKPELRGALNAVSFQDDTEIEIEATLQPQLLSQLAEHSTDSKTAIDYLITCSQNSRSLQKPKKKLKSDVTDQSLVLTPDIDPLLSTES